jgi:glycosyltransferase involved in cell wall biosynthesis
MTGEIPAGRRGRPLRVVVVHNWHRSDQVSGENQAVVADVAALRDAGLDVTLYSRSNDEIDGFGPRRWGGPAGRPIASPLDARALRRLLASARPDVVHLHNVYPLISPWVVRTVCSAGIPLVQTVHNYTHVCAAGTFWRDGHACHDCAQTRFPWPAAIHACYRGSRPQSATLATAIAAHRRTWHLVDRFVAVGQAVAEHLVAAGLPRDRVTVRHNTVADPGAAAPPNDHGGVVFAGRLRAEKGVLLLLDAWELSGLGDRHRLRLIGGGPDAHVVARRARGLSGVELTGQLPHDHVQAAMSNAAVIAVPSLWEEPFGLAAVEALACGRPVLATRRGELARLIDDEVGWLVEPDPESLAGGLRRALHGDNSAKAAAARRRYLERFSPEVTRQQLLDVYHEVIKLRDRRSVADAHD